MRDATTDAIPVRYPRFMTRDSVKTAVVGAGYVGIATAVGLAEQGRDIVLVEQDPDRLAALADGRIPFHEPGLPEAYASQHAAGRIVPSAEIPRDGLDLIVICVGTPIDDTGSTDVSYVARALDQAAAAIAAGAVCVIRSTLPVGRSSRLADRAGVVPERLFVAPEFLRQGSALEDIRRPTQVVVGTFGEHPDPDALALVTGALAQPGSPLLPLETLGLGLVTPDWASAMAVVLLASIIRFGGGEWMQIWQRLRLEIRVVAALLYTEVATNLVAPGKLDARPG